MVRKPAATKKQRKKKPDAQPAAAPARAEAAQPFRAISAQKLRRLIKDKQSTRRAISEQHSGPLGQRIKEAVSKDNLDRTIFNMVEQLDRLDDVTLSHKLATLYYYIDAAGLEERAQNAPQLELGDRAGKANGGGEEDEEGDDGIAPANPADAAKVGQTAH
jgi:hypothetical protein